MLKLRTRFADEPTIDILLVTYNARRWLDGFLAGLAGSDYPHAKIRLIAVDNRSKDDGIAYLQERAKTLPFRVETIVNETNLGFAGGYEVAFANASADFWFVINQDTELVDTALTRLIEVLQADPKIGIAEARQAPREHPKYYDPFTRETSWCSGACMMVRREAAQQVGGFDPAFYMYAEDVDLSWRMWRHGWKCAYVPEAVVRHFTEDLDPHRDRSRAHFYNMRNGAIMRAVYGTVGEAVRHFVRMSCTALFSKNPLWHRWGTAKATIAGLWSLPFALRKRWKLQRLPGHPLVYFNGWEYGRHLTDLAEVDAIGTVPQRWSDRVVVSDDEIQARVLDESKTRRWLDVEVVEMDDGEAKPAIMTWNSEFSIEANLPEDAVLHGLIGQPAQSGHAEGIFSVEIDEKTIFRAVVSRGRPGQGGWMPFSVPLPPTNSRGPARVTMRHMGANADCLGYWSDLKIVEKVAAVAEPDALDVSIIVPTFNRAAGVGGVIQRLIAQDIDPRRYEILVVDNNSTDATREALTAFDQYPQFRSFFCPIKGAAAARNVGLNNARGRLIVMMDDDILVRRDFVSGIWRRHLEDPENILLTKIVHPFHGLVDPFLRYLLAANKVNSYEFPDPDNVPPDFFYTGCVAVPKAVIGETRFDERFKVYGVEDIDFGVELMRGGTRMSFLADTEVWHDYYPRFEFFRKKMGHAGFSLGYYVTKRPWRGCRHVFQPVIVNYSRLLRLATWATTPLARLLEAYEAMRYRPGPVNRLLQKWYSLAIRVSMYRGMMEYFRNKGDAANLPDLGYRGDNGAFKGSKPDDDKQAAA